jgi:hypothetical protein
MFIADRKFGLYFIKVRIMLAMCREPPNSGPEKVAKESYNFVIRPGKAATSSNFSEKGSAYPKLE